MAISEDAILQPPAGSPSLDQAPAEAPAGDPINPAAALETLPADVLEIPAIYAVAKGQPAAVSAPDSSDDPAVKTIQDNAQALVAAGLQLYHSRDGNNWVLFNSSLIDAGSILDADVQGKLAEVAPLFSSVQAPGANPALPGATGAAPGPAQVPESRPPASLESSLATRRQANLSLGSPTSGPKPGAGRLLNALLTPAI